MENKLMDIGQNCIMDDMSMKAISDKLHMELNKKTINWKSIGGFIGSLGETINIYDEDFEESILSEAYKAHSKTGAVNERLTKIFMQNGFDVSANGGKNGASCLRELCWSSDDQYILRIAEFLLDLGADSTLPSKDDKDDESVGVLNEIEWQLGDWNIGEYESANLFTAYYEMIDRQQKGKKYAGIRAFREAVGKTVSKVEKLKLYNYKNEERTSYLFHCGETPLIASDYVEFTVNPYTREEAIEIEDASEEFLDIIGAQVAGLRFINATLAKLNFDNGYTVLVGNDGATRNSEKGAWFKLITHDSEKCLETGLQIPVIRLWGLISHAEDSTFYAEDTIVLDVGDYAYALYSHSKKYGEANIRVEGLEKEMISGVHRYLDVHNSTLIHAAYSGKAMKWLAIKCDEGILYIVTDSFNRVALYMSEYEISEADVMKVNLSTKELKKIKFLER